MAIVFSLSLEIQKQTKILFIHSNIRRGMSSLNKLRFGQKSIIKKISRYEYEQCLYKTAKQSSNEVRRRSLMKTKCGPTWAAQHNNGKKGKQPNKTTEIFFNLHINQRVSNNKMKISLVWIGGFNLHHYQHKWQSFSEIKSLAILRFNCLWIKNIHYIFSLNQSVLSHL